MQRRHFIQSLAVLAAAGGMTPLRAFAATADGIRMGAAWRGPRPGDPYRAGVLSGRWGERSLRIEYEVPLPTRPHGLTADADGGMLVVGVRPGTWMLRCDREGRVISRTPAAENDGDTRLNGHAVISSDRSLVYTTETDFRDGRGRIGVRDYRSLRKLAQWESRGIEPHQLLSGAGGHLFVANGGITRTPSDEKTDLQRMDSSLVKLDSSDGRLLQQWRLDDRRLSLRHLAWSRHPGSSAPILGVALQAEHETREQRERAPGLAVLDGDTLAVPDAGPAARGYAGDISAAWNGGFAISNNAAGTALLWHPALPQQLAKIIEMEQTYALAPWDGPASGGGGGIVAATAPGLVRWHPRAPPAFLAWPQPMALDNHWINMDPEPA